MNDYARNPKTDIRFPYASNRRRFNPPPPFPGALSPTLPTGGKSQTFTAARQDHSNRSTVYHRPSRNTLSYDLAIGSTPKGVAGVGLASGAVNEISSPLMSILLDPHHQPTASGFDQSYSNPQGRRREGRPHRIPKAAALDEDGEGEPDVRERPRQDVESSGDGNLGSWKMEQDYAGSEEEEDVDTVIAAKGAGGVLGMIRQFQKAQVEGRGAA